MKSLTSPREYLLARHTAMKPALDDIRTAVVARSSKLQRGDIEGNSPVVAAFLATLWREIVLPNRRAWSAIAAVWGVILALHLGSRTSTAVSIDPNEAAHSPGVMFAAWQAQRRQLAEYLSIEAPPAPAPRRRERSSAAPGRSPIG